MLNLSLCAWLPSLERNLLIAHNTVQQTCLVTEGHIIVSAATYQSYLPFCLLLLLKPASCPTTSS